VVTTNNSYTNMRLDFNSSSQTPLQTTRLMQKGIIIMTPSQQCALIPLAVAITIHVGGALVHGGHVLQHLHQRKL
jgi:hypothetical protein